MNFSFILLNEEPSFLLLLLFRLRHSTVTFRTLFSVEFLFAYIWWPFISLGSWHEDEEDDEEEVESSELAFSTLFRLSVFLSVFKKRPNGFKITFYRNRISDGILINLNSHLSSPGSFYYCFPFRFRLDLVRSEPVLI